nr:MAG TPA: hypothetical protein [Caudoviricetes sp.]
MVACACLYAVNIACALSLIYCCTTQFNGVLTC